MQNNAVIMRGASASSAIKEWLGSKSAELGSWLDGRSEFFTLISGFTVTRRVALAVNAVAMLVAVAAITAEGNLFLSAAAAIGAVAVVRAGKKGGWL